MAWFSWQQAKLLDPSLAVLDGFFIDPPRKVQPVTGGLTNRCWRLEDAQGLGYIWRPTGQVCEAFSISRYNEYQVLNAISPFKIGPEPIFVHDKGLLVEWIEGEALTDTGIELSELLSVAATIHRYPINTPPLRRFSYMARIDHYWCQLEGRYLGTEFESLYLKWRQDPNIEPVPVSLCHFDLGCYNLVRGNDGIKVIDWEYAALSDPRLDLALIIQVAGASVEEAVAQYCHKREIADSSLWLAGVKAWQPRTLVIAMLWYLLAYKLWGDEQYLISAHELKSALCTDDDCFENS